MRSTTAVLCLANGLYFSLLVIGMMPGEARAQVIQPTGPGLALPIRWCALEGTPTVVNPEYVGEVDSDGVLWRRHERFSEAVSIPQTRVTFRSSLWSVGAGFPTRFPVIEDPDPPLPGPDNTRGDLGDLGDPFEQIPHPDVVVYNTYPWNKVYRECVAAWRARGVNDLGVVAIVVRRLRRQDGTLSDFAGLGEYGNRKILLTDNAFVLGGSPLASGASDHVDKLLGHELGHTLPTQRSDATNTRGLRHTCSSTRNLMRQGVFDLFPSDGLIDNFLLSPSIEQLLDSGPDGFACNSDDPPGLEAIDQIEAWIGAVRNSPGCKLIGTNVDCSDATGDECPDPAGDLPARFADIVSVRISEWAGRTTLAHDVFGRIDEALVTTTRSLEFIVMIDMDQNSASGADVAQLGLPSDFEGAEVVTRVEWLPFIPPGRSDDSKAETVTLRSTVWRAEGGAFSEVVGAPVEVRIQPSILAAEGETIHVADRVEIELPTTVLGPRSDIVRVQGMSVVHDADDTSTIDRLDDRTDESGFEFRFESPSFPLCRVLPELATAGREATIEAFGLLPGAQIKVFFGAEKVATGLSDGVGAIDISFRVPSDTTNGEHLVTVGVDGTALTADCLARTEAFPDCNRNGLDDIDDIASGAAEDRNANGEPDSCEMRRSSWIFEGSATGGQIDTVVEGWDATCLVSVPTTAGETGEIVAANVAAALSTEPCLVDQGITATADGNRVILEGLDLSAHDVGYTTTDTGLMHRSPVTDIPTLSVGMLAFFAGVLALLIWRRGAFQSH